jgi:hemerythrin
MTLVDPNAIPQVALHSMNDTHAEEVELINRIADLLQQDSSTLDRSALEQALDEWLEHTRQHFEREHALMEQSGFPAYPIHRREHQRVLGLIEQLVEDFRRGGEIAPLADFVLEQWPAWFDQHVRTMDTATAQFARMRGLA